MTHRTEIKGQAEWRLGQRIKNSAIYGLAAAAMWLVGRLPLNLARALGAAAGWLGWVVAPFERRQAFTNLSTAFPELGGTERRRLARRCFLSLGERAAEICQLRRLDLPRYVTIEPAGRRLIDQALARGRGLLWVTAHLGNWELLAVGLTAHGYDVRPVATPSYDPRFTAMIDRWRRNHQVQTIWRGRDDFGPAVANALTSGAIVGLLIDQDTRVRGCFVPFFGRLAWTPSGAAALARQTKAPILTGFIRRRADGGHVIEVAVPEMTLTGMAERDDHRNTAVLTEAIEEAVRSTPSEWVWMHRRWRTRPPDEDQAKVGGDR